MSQISERGGGSSLFGTLSEIFLFFDYDASPVYLQLPRSVKNIISSFFIQPPVERICAVKNHLDSIIDPSTVFLLLMVSNQLSDSQLRECPALAVWRNLQWTFFSVFRFCFSGKKIKIHYYGCDYQLCAF